MTPATTTTTTTQGTRDVPSWKRIFAVARSEGVRMRRRSFAGLGLLAVALLTLMATFAAFTTADMAAEVGGSLPLFGAIGDVTAADGIVAGLVMAADIIGIAMLALWAAAVASDYSSGWVRLTVQAEPRRWRLLAGKLVTLAGFTLLATSLATVISLAAAPLAAAATDIDTSAWGTDIVPIVVEGWINVSITALAWGAIGFVVAVVTRSAVAAIAGGIGYLLVVEGMLSRIAEDAAAYLPGAILDAVMAGGNSTLSYGAAMGLALAVIAGCIAIATVVFGRRDVTS